MNSKNKTAGTRDYPIWKYKDGNSTTQHDTLAIETPLLIKLKSPDQSIEDLVITMHTPVHTEDLVRGFLYTEGVIDHLDHIQTIELQGEEAIVSLSQAPIKSAARNTVSTAACGMCGKTSLDAIDLVRTFDLSKQENSISTDALLGFDPLLSAQQVLFEATGGIHAAALFDYSGQMILVREDIGRHNAVDKTIGSMLQKGLNRDNLILFVSGRAGFELVQKALVSGISMMVAVGAPSSLARDYALEYGLTLIGFMQKGRFNVYSHPKRVQ